MPDTIRVLYVDDEPSLLEITKLFLEKSGEFAVDILTSATDALTCIPERSYDAIISDYQMPDMDGIEFLREVRSSGSAVPFILFTGRGREEVVIDAINNGADFYIQKGGQPRAQFAELTHKVRQAVQRRRAEVSLQQSEAKYRELADLLPQMVFEMDPDFHVTYANRHALASMGVTDEDLKEGVNAVSLIDPSQHERARKNIRQQIEGVSLESQEYTLVRRDGSTIPVLVDTAPIFRNGALAGFRGVMIDISSRKRMEAELRESEEKYRLVVENSDNAVYIYRGSRILFANCRAVEFTGFPHGELVCMDLWELIHPDDRPRLQRNGQLRMAGNALPPDFTARLIQKGGEVRECEFFVNRIIYRNEPALLGIVRDVSEQKKVQGAIQASEELFRGMAERSSDLIIILDEQMSPVYVSPSSRFMVGYDPEELVGRPPEFAMATIFSHSGVELKDAVSRTMNGVLVENIELQLTRKDRSTVFVSLNAVPIINDGGLAGAQVVMRDTTGSRRMEAALRESEAKYRLLADHVRDVIWTADMDMNLTYVSPSVTALRGLSPEEALSESIRDALTPASYRTITQMREAGLDEWKKTGWMKEFQLMELEFYRTDGSTVWTEVVISPIFGDGKKPVGVVGVTRDITRRKEVEAALRESEEKFRAIVETSPDMIWEIDLEGRFRYMSPQVATVMGYPAEEIIGRSVFDLASGEGQPVAMEAMMRCRSRDGPLVPFEVPARHRDGHDMVIEVRPSLAGTEEVPAGFRGVAVDITERKKAEEALRRANRQLALLSGITRHDILNQVSVARGFLQLAEMMADDNEVARYLQKVDAAVTTIQSQIEFTRVYEDIGTLDPRWIDLAAVMPTGHAPATIRLTAGVQGVRVFADPMLEKVFFTLLDNSVRHGRRVTDVEVSYHLRGDDLVVVWEDNGVGIGPENKERIFGRGVGTNTGLGLFLVREILSLTGIAITETGDEDAGARFEIVVPKNGYRFTDELRMVSG